MTGYSIVTGGYGAENRLIVTFGFESAVHNTLFDEVIEQLEQQNVSTNLWYSVYMYKHGFVWYDYEFCILFDEGLEQLEK